MLRLDRLLGDAGDKKPVERFLAVLQGVNEVTTGWETTCPSCDGRRGFVVRVEPVVEERVPIAWCSAGCPDQAVLVVLTERLRKAENQEAVPAEGPPAVPAMVPPSRGASMTRNPAPSLSGGLLTIREAAAFLRLHPRTVREYVRAGELEGRVIGGRWRFRRKDLDAFYENAPRTWDWQRKHEPEE